MDEGYKKVDQRVSRGAAARGESPEGLQRAVEAASTPSPVPLSKVPATERREQAWQGIAVKLGQELANKQGGTYEEWIQWAAGAREDKPRRKAHKVRP